jgi:hypothetical protein
MTEDGHDLVARVHREAWERYRQQPPPPPKERPTIHYTELPPAKPGEELAEEWETYRREVGRLLAEGNEGRYILIKGSEIIGIWDDEEDALTTAYKMFPLQSFLIRRIQERERLLYMIQHPI